MSRRIVALGNCQAPAFSNCLRAIDNSVRSNGFTINQVRSLKSQDRIFKALQAADTIFVQPYKDTTYPDRVTALLRESSGKIVFYPGVAFHGFHPDATLLRRGKGQLRSACGVYHSIIVAACFVVGIPKARVPNLFNAYIFASLKYFEKFDAWKEVLLMRADGIGYDLRNDFQEWLAAGPFMHTINHPTIRVIASIAIKAYRKAGFGDGQMSALPNDGLLRGERLPVFPEIARRVGTDAILTFQPACSVASTECRQINLQQYINDTYQLYSDYPERVFTTSTAINEASELLKREVVA